MLFRNLIADRSANWQDSAKMWFVFILCLIAAAGGVAISFLTFGSTITGIDRWTIGFAIAVFMLGISYTAKYASADARKHFTPVDAIQYFSQGFLWPSTWPALADALGVQKVEPVLETSTAGFDAVLQLLGNVPFGLS